MQAYFRLSALSRLGWILKSTEVVVCMQARVDIKVKRPKSIDFGMASSSSLIAAR